MDGLFTAENLIAFVALAGMEIVLGIDNIVFIAILTGKVPEAQRARLRNIGLLLALVMRIGLLFGITWIMGLTRVLASFTIPFLKDADGPKVIEITGQSIILILGGLFLLGKATHEIHHKMEGGPQTTGEDAATVAVGATGAGPAAARGAGLIIVQIILLDLVFSLDSVITAVGMAKSIWVMVAAVLVSVGVMIAFAGRISGFIEKHRALKMLALAFLVLIGVMLLVEGLGEHVPKGYVYFAMAFSLGVEVLNIKGGARKAAAPKA